MNQVPALRFERNKSERVVAGVCGGLGRTLRVDATLIRLVFALLAVAGGAGILLYFALWVYSNGRRVFGIVLVAAAAAGLLSALGFSNASVFGAGLIAAGLGTVVVRGGSVRPGGSLPVLGIVLLTAGAVFFLGQGSGAA